ncbi:MAG: citrate transporter [Clostridiaceae bacterium]|jgi:H+/gluconate symporter-like permease|nr:citrate transporter [Clostridiaceae bacterium]
MQTLQAIGILVVFLAMVVLLMTRKISVIIALPVAGFLFCLIAGIPFMSSDPEVKTTIMTDVLEKGAYAMASTMGAAIFGAIFGSVLNHTGISKSIIRKAAELAGDKPLPVALALLVAAALIFSGATFVGITIMVGTIALPIMMSVGISPLLAATVLLCGQALGSGLNVSTWAIYQNTLGLDIAVIGKYTPFILVPMAITAVAMIVYNLKREKHVRRAWAMPTEADTEGEKPVRGISLITPIIPIVIVLAFKFDVIPALMIGIICACILATPKKPLQLITKCFVEGIQNVAGALAVIIGVGIIYTAVRTPQVLAVLEPIITVIAPKNPLVFIIVFGILAPFALYRGPLNMYGMGAGLAAIFAAVGMNPVAAMFGLRTDAYLQVSTCPTNSQNVWVADFTKTEVNDIMKRHIIFLWPACIITAAIGAIMIF